MQECMKGDKKIQILLSTYNGEKYLREQLDSYLNQVEVCNISVLVRDDGSVDNTTDILQEYHQKYGFEIVMGENLGVNESMFWLFTHSDLTCDYFALSDQDDVWLKYKLKIAINKLETLDNSKPAMFASCSEIVDEELNHKGSSIEPKKGVSFFNAIVQNVTPGHTQVFNRAMMMELVIKGIKDVHVIDWWLYLVATGIGTVAFEKSFTVKHRQHGKNSEGYEVNFIKQFLKRLKKIQTEKANGISLQLRSFYNLYSQDLEKEKKQEIESYFKLQRNFLKRIKYVVTCRAFRQSRFETLVFKVLYVLGKYNIRRQNE